MTDHADAIFRFLRWTPLPILLLLFFDVRSVLARISPAGVFVKECFPILGNFFLVKRLIACINSATGLLTVKARRFATIMLTGGIEGLARTVLDILGESRYCAGINLVIYLNNR